MSKRKGIILAGGLGTRLYPMTLSTSKQLLPVYDKPMIYYPLSVLMLSGIKEFLLITSQKDLDQFKSLLHDGSQWGISLAYLEQEKPAGIAQAFLIGEDFIGDDDVTLILGDNIFHGNLRIREIISNFSRGAWVFGYYVNDPERYGVVEFNEQGQVLGIEEKPDAPKSHYAVPGLYIYDNHVVEYARNLQPSARGELEITDLNLVYLKRQELMVQVLGRGIAWLDTGTHRSLLEAANFIQTLQDRQGLRIGCLEEVAYHMRFIDHSQMEKVVSAMPKSDYQSYLMRRVLEI